MKTKYEFIKKKKRIYKTVQNATLFNYSVSWPNGSLHSQYASFYVDFCRKSISFKKKYNLNKIVFTPQFSLANSNNLDPPSPPALQGCRSGL